jgi:hypothetical protein
MVLKIACALTISRQETVWRTLLALMLLTSPGCAQIAQPSEGATPPAEQPAYAALAAKYFSETMADRLSFENFEISELRWVHGLNISRMIWRLSG